MVGLLVCALFFILFSLACLASVGLRGSNVYISKNAVAFAC